MRIGFTSVIQQIVKENVTYSVQDKVGLVLKTGIVVPFLPVFSLHLEKILKDLEPVFIFVS